MLYFSATDPRILFAPDGEVSTLDTVWPDAGTVPVGPGRTRVTDAPGEGRTGAGDELGDGVLLVVESGPDAGLVAPLPRGRSLIGRGPCRVRLEDPTVSRRHAEIDVSPGGIEITARAPITVQGRPVACAHLDESRRIGIGENRLRVLPRAPRTGTGPPTSDTHLPWDAVTAEGPPPPPPPVAAAVGAVAPLGIGLVLALVSGYWLLLALGCVGLVTGGVTVTEAVTRRRRHRRASRARARRRAHDWCSAHPGPGTWLAGFRAARAGLPSPRASPPPARIGDCLRPRIRVLMEHGRQERSRTVNVDSLPALCAPGPGQDVLLRGRPEHVGAVLRCLMLAWLPGPGEGLGVAAVASLPARVLAWPGVHLVDPDLPAPSAAPVLTWTGRDATTSRVFVHGATTVGDQAALAIDLGTGEGTAARPASIHDRSRDQDPIAFRPDTITRRAADLAVTAVLEQLPRETGPKREFPSSGPVVPGPATGETGLRAVIGRDGHDEVELDLVGDGPHALVAGTTGAGKSVLLQGWLGHLALHHPPHELRLVLLDFKGGAGFDRLATLPHVEALVTDLDPESTRRVIDGITGELERRERLLRDHGAADLDGLDPSNRPARIVVAVDEFRLLAETVPQVLNDLLRCATVGRSLGLHLILATQRPQGVISPEIRANTTLTLCLRLTSEAESTDLLGVPDAARISPTTPGGGLLRIGSAPPRPFQTIEPDHDDPHASPPARRHLIGPSCADLEELPAPAAAQATPTPPAPALPRTRPFIAPCLPSDPSRVAGGRDPHAIRLGLEARTDRLVPWLYRPDTDGPLALIAAPGPIRRAQVHAWLRATARTPWGPASVVLDGEGLAEAPPGLGLVLSPSDQDDADEALTALAAGGTPCPSIPPPPGRTGSCRALLWVLSASTWFSDGTDARGLAREAAVKTLTSSGDVGLVVVGGRELSGSTFLSHIPHRVHVPYSLGAEAKAMWPRMRDCAERPGRGVLLGPDRDGPDADGLGRVVQAVGVPDPTPARAGSRNVSRHGADTRAPGPGTPAWTRLPRHITPEQLHARGRDPSALAVRAPDLAPVQWEPTSASALVLAPPGAGCTTVLDRFAALRGPEAIRLDHAGLAADGMEPHQQPQRWWIVDDLHLLTPDAVGLLAERARVGGRLLVGARFSGRIPHQLTWWHHVDQLGGIFLLGPRSNEAQVLGWRVRADPQAPPGRGWCVPRGESAPVRVQVPFGSLPGTLTTGGGGAGQRGRSSASSHRRVSGENTVTSATPPTTSSPTPIQKPAQSSNLGPLDM